MKQATKAKLLKTLRTAHGWLGLFVFPWVLIIGLTGLYQNHSKLVLGWIGSRDYDESRFTEWPQDLPLTLAEAGAIAQTIWPEEGIQEFTNEPYHNLPSYIFIKETGRIIVTKATGHYYVKTSLTNRLYDPNGIELHKKIYWGSVFNWLHERGWLSNRFGTWLADITAGSMAIFALSGLLMFFLPRTKKIARALKTLKSRWISAP